MYWHGHNRSLPSCISFFNSNGVLISFFTMPGPANRMGSSCGCEVHAGRLTQLVPT